MQVSSGLIGSDRFDFIRAGSLLAMNTFGGDFISHILLLLLVILLNQQLVPLPSSSSSSSFSFSSCDKRENEDDDECVDRNSTDHRSKEESKMTVVHHMFIFRSVQITLNFISIFILKRLFTFKILYSIIQHINILSMIVPLWKKSKHPKLWSNHSMLYIKHCYYQKLILFFNIRFFILLYQASYDVGCFCP